MLVFGGEQSDDLPRVDDMTVVHKETSGPTASLITFFNEAEIEELANGIDFRLAVGI